jgi:cytochrome d ubiquinol oxidase subunit II
MANGGAGAWVTALLTVAAVTVAAAVIGRGRDGLAFSATAVTVATVVGTIFVNLHLPVMVSTLGAANDLTIQNSSSASYSLTVMTLVAAVVLPLILLHQGWTYYVLRQRLGRAAVVVPATSQISGQRMPPPPERSQEGSRVGKPRGCAPTAADSHRLTALQEVAPTGGSPRRHVRRLI